MFVKGILVKRRVMEDREQRVRLGIHGQDSHALVYSHLLLLFQSNANLDQDCWEGILKL